jgi:Domain of unknown function (DUF4190)
MAELAPPRRYSRVAVTAALNGVAGLVIVPFGCALAAIFFGVWGRQRTERKPELRGHGLATAGIALGALGLLVSLVGLASSGEWTWSTLEGL